MQEGQFSSLRRVASEFSCLTFNQQYFGKSLQRLIVSFIYLRDNVPCSAIQKAINSFYKRLNAQAQLKRLDNWQKPFIGTALMPKKHPSYTVLLKKKHKKNQRKYKGKTLRMTERCAIFRGTFNSQKKGNLVLMDSRQSRNCAFLGGSTDTVWTALGCTCQPKKAISGALGDSMNQTVPWFCRDLKVADKIWRQVATDRRKWKTKKLSLI